MKIRYKANGPEIIRRMAVLKITKQWAFCQEIGISVKTLQRYKNSGPANLRELEKLATGLNCQWQDIGAEIDEAEYKRIEAEYKRIEEAEYKRINPTEDTLEETEADYPAQDTVPQEGSSHAANIAVKSHIHVYKLLAIISLIIIAIGLAIYGVCRLEIARPINLVWLPRMPGKVAEPYVLCSIENKIPYYADVQHDSQNISQVPTGKSLAWRIRLGDPDDASDWFNLLAQKFGYKGLYITTVMIGQKTGITDNSFGIPNLHNPRILPGRTWQYHKLLGNTEEDKLFVILVNRDQPIDIVELKNELQYRFGEQNIDLSAAAQYLSEHDNGNLHFMFSTQTGAHNCEK